MSVGVGPLPGKITPILSRKINVLDTRKQIEKPHFWKKPYFIFSLPLAVRKR
jgi:hypothetical protein